MHTNLCPHVTKTLSPNTYVPNPNPLRHPHSLPIEPTLILTTLDPHKRTAVTIPINNHEIVSNLPSSSSGKEADNLEQQLYPNQLADPPDERMTELLIQWCFMMVILNLHLAMKMKTLCLMMKILLLMKPLECVEERL